MNHRVPRDPRQNEFHHRRLLIPGAAFFFDNALACHKYDSHKIRPVTFHGFSPCPIAAGLQGLEIGNSSLRVATTAHNDPYLGINLRANSSGFDFSLSFFFFLERLSIILRLYLERVERDFRNASTWKEEVLIPPLIISIHPTFIEIEHFRFRSFNRIS